jgi:beta-glucuronidase
VLIAHPKLWAPGSPYLYPATFTLADARGRRLGGYFYQSGIRQISIADGEMYLNGRQLHLRGVDLHEQTVSTGAALSLAQEEQYISWFQQLGVTLVRAHYPLNPELEQMADQAGILLWSEVPVYESKPRYQAMAAWRNRAVALVKANIDANQSHPSILVWSIGNELGNPPGRGLTDYIREAAAAANSLDPTRPVGLAISDWPGIPCQPAYAPLQVLGINEYFGWFDVEGATADRAELRPFMQSLRGCYGNQAMIVTEFGFGGNRNGPVEVMGTYLYQINSIQYHVGVFNSLSWLSGAAYFPIQDFAARPDFTGGDPLGTPPWIDKGVLDQNGNPKPSFGVMAALYKGIEQIGPPVLTKLGEPTKPTKTHPAAT